MSKTPKRLMSLDAYRGLVMLAMASGGFAFSQVAPKVADRFDGTSGQDWWRFLWRTLAYQFDHVAWTGCSFWDLIQPSFMFMVGVAMPFSMQRRADDGESPIRRWLHAAKRAVLLVFLGVLLSSSQSGINFTFVNVLAQIGLGYLFLLPLVGRNLKTLAVVATVILGGYGAWFVYQPIDEPQSFQTKEYVLNESKNRTPEEWSQFQGHAAHWNKHINAAAQADRALLNKFPRSEKPWSGRSFWINAGGYQTLNFIPSIVTMILGLMAGSVLKGERDESQKLRWLLKAGLVCFVVSLSADSTLWPVQWLKPEWQAKIAEFSWSLCPAVKRVWTPTWAVFSGGWAFWILGAFYWLVDVKGYQKIVMPLAVVGINSIAMYCLSQLFRGWIGGAIKVVLTTIDQFAGWQTGLGFWLDPDRWAYAPILDNALRLAVLWGVCLWLYRRRLFIRL